MDQSHCELRPLGLVAQGSIPYVHIGSANLVQIISVSVSGMLVALFFFTLREVITMQNITMGTRMLLFVVLHWIFSAGIRCVAGALPA